MYTRKLTASKLFAAVLAAAMLLTMTVSAFASDIQPYYDSEVLITGSVSATSQTYSVTVTAPTDVTKVKFDATLYQKQLFGRKKIDTMSASSNTNYCSKYESVTIQTGKNYEIDITAQVYSDGAWETIESTMSAKT